MMVTQLINKRLVDAAPSAEKDTFMWDRDVGGFGLKVSPAGRKVYVLQYRMGGRGSSTQRYTIGKHGSPWTPDGARKEARRLLEEVRRGVDPRLQARDQARARSEHPFHEYLESFLSNHCKRHWAPRTLASAESNLRRHVLPHLKAKPLASIDRWTIVEIMDCIPAHSPALARSVFAHTRRLFSWAVERGDLETSPFSGLGSPAPVASRDRVLADIELQAIWLASQELTGVYGNFVRLLILTGQRRDEVAGMQWSEVDIATKTWKLPRGRTKNGQAHLVPLTGEMISEIQLLAKIRNPGGEHVFASSGQSYISAFSSAKRKIDAELSRLSAEQCIAPWRLHDLRRTFATGMQRLGIRFEVTEALLNHVSGAKAGVAGVYQRHDWADEKRDALEIWSKHVSELGALAKATPK